MSVVLIALLLPADGLDPSLAKVQAARVATIQRIEPTVVSVFGPKGDGGGSGVLVSRDGFVLTNFHVTQRNAALRCGLSDGRVYDAVLVGLDPVGDVAMIQMLGRDDFPFATIGDSDRLQVGEPVMALGNPFLLATDFRPTATLGIVSGLHRYQYPAGTLLEYADCIQTDAAINPGNSGGPLFDGEGRLVGINGRASFKERGRVSVGVGYAISIRQILRFVDHLKGGLVVDHANLGATVVADEVGRVVVDAIVDSSGAYYAGLRPGDEILSCSGRAIPSPNQLKNVIGTYPAGSGVEIRFRRGRESLAAWVRLSGVHRPGELAKKAAVIEPDAPSVQLPRAIRARYEAKAGYANYHFNRLRRDPLLKGLGASFSSAGSQSKWRFHGVNDRKQPTTLTITDSLAAWESGTDRFLYQPGEEEDADPAGVEGSLAALFQWRKLLRERDRGFSSCDYAGAFDDRHGVRLPVVDTERGGIAAHWMFDSTSGRLTAVECDAVAKKPPCEIGFSDYRNVGGRSLPHRLELRRAGSTVATLSIQRIEGIE